MMKFRFLLLVMVSAILLQGCAIGYIGAHLGMMGIAVTQIRPDRKLDYTFEIRTGQNETLIFQGSTDCPHGIIANSGGYYSTEQSYSVLMQDDKKWILTGIYCNDEIKTKWKRRFVVYQEINDLQGKVYFVAPGGNVELVNASIDKPLTLFARKNRGYYNKYPDGPYLYRKYFLAEKPNAVKGLTDPVVIHSGNNFCAEHNTAQVSIDKRDIYEQFSKNIPVGEEGYLEYRSENGSWTPKTGLDLTLPMDVAVNWNAYAMYRPRDNKPDELCVRFFVENQIFYVSKHRVGSSMIYIPTENAYYIIRHVRFYDDFESLIKTKK